MKPTDSIPVETDLPIDHISSSAWHSRRALDPVHIANLAKSMALVGQLQRIAVRRTGTGWQVIYGECRLRAARMLEWPGIAVRIIDADDTASLVISAAENLHHDALSLIDSVDVVMRLQEAGLSASVIARVLTRSDAWVNDVLVLARDPIARAMADADLIATADAWTALMALPADSRRKLLDAGEPITIASCKREQKRLDANEGRRQFALRKCNSSATEA